MRFQMKLKLIAALTLPMLVSPLALANKSYDSNLLKSYFTNMPHLHGTLFTLMSFYCDHNRWPTQAQLNHLSPVQQRTRISEYQPPSEQHHNLQLRYQPEPFSAWHLELQSYQSQMTHRPYFMLTVNSGTAHASIAADGVAYCSHQHLSDIMLLLREPGQVEASQLGYLLQTRALASTGKIPFITAYYRDKNPQSTS